MSEHGYQGEGYSELEQLRYLRESLPYTSFLDRYHGEALTPISESEALDVIDAESGNYQGKVRLHHDFEWYSDLDVTQVGVSRVSRHQSTDALMCAYAFNDGEVDQWVPDEGQKIPKDLLDATRDPGVLKFAWNKPAEYCTWKNVLGIDIPHEQWIDPMVLAYSLSLPGKLSRAGAVVGLSEDKAKTANGMKLIRTFSKPVKPTKAKPFVRRNYITDPDLWDEFKAYNRQDVRAERGVWRKLRKWDLPQDEWALWHIDQDINERGIPINLTVVRNAIKVSRDVVLRRLAIMKDLTGLANPNAPAQLLGWLREQGTELYPFEDLKKGHVATALRRIEDACQDDFALQQETVDIRRVLELRQEVSKASVKKYNALANRTDEDGMLRYAFQFAGAGRTWRWAGRGYQAQNLAKPDPTLERMDQQLEAVAHLEVLDSEQIEWLYPKPMALLSTCVRPVAQAVMNYTFADADLAAIENIVLGWMSGCSKILNVFEEGRDPYIDFATYLFHKPYSELWAEYKERGEKKRRTLAKPGVLGCGYMLGAGEEKENPRTGEIEATGLLGYAWNMGIKLTPEESSMSVKVWRETFSEAVDYWYEIDRAARKTISTGRRHEAGPVWFDRSGPWLRMHLPSGRCLHYCRPRLEQKRMPWGDMKLSITYEGLNDKGQWARLSTHPGKITENADQAIARDILANGIRLAKKQGLDVRIHVHDQILVMSHKVKAERELAILRECMQTKPSWAPTIPINSAGFVAPAFMKD